jgi:hypothetical protein
MSATVNYTGLTDAYNAIEPALLHTGITSAAVKLAKAPFTPSPNSVTADFTEADFAGYTAGGIPVAAWDFAHVDAEGQIRANNGTPLQWIYGGVGGPNTLYGYWMEDIAGNVVMSELFSPPITIDPGNPVLSISISYCVAQFAQSVVILP